MACYTQFYLLSAGLDPVKGPYALLSLLFRIHVPPCYHTPEESVTAARHSTKIFQTSLLILSNCSTHDRLPIQTHLTLQLSETSGFSMTSTVFWNMKPRELYQHSRTICCPHLEGWSQAGKEQIITPLTWLTLRP
jgi:hypothetical protein